jgi:predicted DNA-binding protein
MMQRTQISLDPELLRRAKRKAAELGVSLAEYIRRLVARDVEEGSQEQFDVTRIFALGNSGGSNVARHKDEYLAEAIENQK